MTDAFACSDCGWCTFYERERCPDCGCGSFETVDPGVGELLAVTHVHVTPSGVRRRNPLGLARFSGDVDVVAQLDDDLEPGERVRLEDGFALRETDGRALAGSRLVAAE